jgi:hypothetical protein
LGRSLKSSQKQVTITNYSQNKCFVWWSHRTSQNKTFWIIPLFWLLVHLLPIISLYNQEFAVSFYLYIFKLRLMCKFVHILKQQFIKVCVALIVETLKVSKYVFCVKGYKSPHGQQ